MQKSFRLIHICNSTFKIEIKTCKHKKFYSSQFSDVEQNGKGNNQNKSWKKFLGFRNMQEKLENLMDKDPKSSGAF